MTAKSKVVRSSGGKLAEALARVEQVEELVERGEDVDAALEKVTGINNLPVDVATGLTAAIDRWLAVEHAFRGKEQVTKELRDLARYRYDSVKKAHSRFKQRLRFLMAQHPDIVFKGTENEFRLQKNGGLAKLETFFPTYELSGLVDPAEIERLDIPKECVEERTVYVLNTDKLRELIKQGAGSDAVARAEVMNAEGEYTEGFSAFGKLTRGSQVRIK